MNKIATRTLLIVWLLALTVAPAIVAQAPILDVVFEAETVTVPAGGTVAADARVTNTSVQEADDVEISLLEGPVALAAVNPIDVIPPFGDARIRLLLSADESADLGPAEARFEVLYTYCVGDVCYQILEEIGLSIEVSAAVPAQDGDGVSDHVVPATTVEDLPTDGRKVWQVVLPIVLAVLLAATLWISCTRLRHWSLRLVVFLILGALLGAGFAMNQDQQAQSIGAVLCTSCVGIELTPHAEAELSADARERLAALDEPIELLVFSAPWCHACPYAKEIAAQAAEAAPALTVRVIDVEEDREAADRYGIIQSGRTIVPAIVRVDTDEILFGIEDLEQRLLSLLEGL